MPPTGGATLILEQRTSTLGKLQTRIRICGKWQLSAHLRVYRNATHVCAEVGIDA